MAVIKVLISGITGKMGLEAAAAISSETNLELIGGTCAHDRGATLATSAGNVALSTDLDSLLEKSQPDVMLELTNATVGMESAVKAAARKVNIVMGASGFSEEQLKQLDVLANENSIGIIVAPNFALGAVVLKKLAEQAAPYFDYVDLSLIHI